MTKRMLIALCCGYGFLGCAPSQEVTPESSAWWTAAKARFAPAAWTAEESGLGCHGDHDCPVAELCHPERSRCVSAYPDSRLLVANPSEKEDCWLANLYFAYNSTELISQSQSWLQYNIRCLRTRAAPALILKGHADGPVTGSSSQRLAVERGNAVKQVLLDAGIELPIRVRGRGDRKPLRLAESERDYEYDRRVEFWAL